MPKSPTNELTAKILDWLLRQPNTIAWRNNTIGIPMADGGLRAVGKRGVGDILCISKPEGATHGVFWNIELKVSKGDKLRPEQISFAKSVINAGGRSIVVKTWEDFIKQYANS